MTYRIERSPRSTVERGAPPADKGPDRGRCGVGGGWRGVGIFLLVAGWGLAQGGAASAKVDAQKGVRYTLSKDHGPWMIMVTSLYGDTPQQYARASKAADELVLELRRKGLPAYVYEQKPERETVATVDRLGREDKRVYKTQQNMIGILAGNYPGIEDATAQKTLKFVKGYRPKVLSDAGYGGIESGPGPLHKAFLTMNPLIKPEDVARRTRDPLLVRLNSGTEYSLYDNKRKHTLIVASFYGKSQIKPTKFAEFEEKLKTNVSLDQAALDSWQLVKTLRTQGYDAYVFHERFRSIVTVGGFNSPEESEVQRLKNLFGAKYRKNPDSGKDVLVSESIQIPGRKEGDPPLKSFTLDPVPELMDVPRAK